MSDPVIGPGAHGKPPNPRYVFDLTTVAYSDGRMAGIPRAEFSLANELRELLGDEIEFILYSKVRKEFFHVPPHGLNYASFKKLLNLLDKGDQSIAPARFDVESTTSLVVFTCGFAWIRFSLSFTESLFRFVRSHRAKVCVMVHDLIPYRFPYWFERSVAPRLNSSLSIISQQADLVACISCNTQRDLIQFCENERLSPPATVAIRLGDEAEIAHDSSFWEEHETGAMAIEKPFVLAVGAIKQRKNYELLYAAWKTLLSHKVDVPTLVTVGGCVAGGHETFRMFLQDKDLAGHVLIQPDVSDDQLGWLYRNSLFTVYPSLYEGWGLPVCESFRLGKICLAADNSSIPEIFPGYPEYLSANNADLWAERVAHFSSNVSARLELEAYIKQNYRPHSWKDTARDLLGCLHNLAASEKPARSQQAPTLPAVAKTIDFSQLRSSIYPATGWSEHESWGRWARGPRAGISLALAPNSAGEETCLIVKMKGSRPHAVKIHVNGELRETCHVGMELENFIIPLSQQDLASGNLEFVWESEQPSTKPVAALHSIVGISQLAIERVSSLKCSVPARDKSRSGRLWSSDKRKSLIVGALANKAASRIGSSQTAAALRGREERSDLDRENLTPLEKLIESHEHYLNTAQRTRECEKQLRKLPRQIQFRLGSEIVRAVDRPAELLFTPWRVTMLLVEAWRGRRARREQPVHDALQPPAFHPPGAASRERHRITFHPLRPSVVWLNCFFHGLQGKTGQFVVRLNGRIIQQIKVKAKTFRLMKIDLNDGGSNPSSNVSIELEALTRGVDQQWRAEIVETLVDVNDFLALPAHVGAPTTVSLNEPIPCGLESAFQSYEFLGFGWQGFDQDGVKSTGSICELEFLLPCSIEKPEITFSLKYGDRSDSAFSAGVGYIRGLVGKLFSSQRTIQVSANGQPLGSVSLARDKFATLRLPSPCSWEGALAVRLEIDKALPGEHISIRDFTVHA